MCNLTYKKSGFTLIELIVVIALMSLIALFALPNVSNYFKVNLKSTVREIATIVVSAYNSTMLTGKVHRVVYDLDKNEYWVESGSSSFLLESERSLEEKERLGIEEDEDDSDFSIDNTITEKKISLPSGVTFKGLFTQKDEEIIEDGLAYTHIFPHGFTEKTVIQLEDSADHFVTLILYPFLGKTKMVQKHVSGFKEAFSNESS